VLRYLIVQVTVRLVPRNVAIGMVDFYSKNYPGTLSDSPLCDQTRHLG
jgi:hypothetical protein